MEKQTATQGQDIHWSLALLLSFFFFCARLGAQEAEGEGPKSKAYEAFRQNRLADAATQFEQYLKANPKDISVALDYASALSQLKRPQDAARILEGVHRQQPANEAAYFKLGEVYVQMQKYAEAEKVFQELSTSRNADLATSAREALRNVQQQIARDYKADTERKIYELAAQSKYREELEVIDQLEKLGPLAYSMQMQRLYALQGAGEFANALARANKLAETNPQATDLALLRADLLVQLGRRPEAQAIWRKLEKERPGTSPGLIAGERLQGSPRPEEETIFRLAQEGKYQQVIEAINRLEAKEGKLSLTMEKQRLYAWQSLGRIDLALERLDKLAQKNPASTDLALLRADLLVEQREWKKAARVYKDIIDGNPNTTAATQAKERIGGIPPYYNISKWYWGEAYTAGQYLGRFGAVVGSGFIRQGFYVPELRWLQPYAEFAFTADTRGGIGRERSLIADNFVGLYGGVRAQLLPTEYLFCYIAGGASIDLLGRRAQGDWASDYQAGIYGFKSWGPGTVLLSSTPGESVIATGSLPAGSRTTATAGPDHPGCTNRLFWRGDWFTDAGANFSYYDRFSSWIGYGQAHQGFRLFQLGCHAAIDAYAVENLSWDVRGDYFDNLAEIGPGARLLWVPHKGWEVVLRAEYLNGFYFGRDQLHNRDGASSHYDDFRATLSIGVRW